MTTLRTINVTTGYTDYAVAQVTEATGKDLSTATIKAALVAYTIKIPPASNANVWRTPTITYPNMGTATVSLLIGAETTPGDYYMWIDITDNPTVVPVKATTLVRVV